MSRVVLPALVLIAACTAAAWFPAPAAAQSTDTSSWISSGIQPRPQQKSAKIIRTAPFQPTSPLKLPEPGANGVIVTRAPTPDVPTLPSTVPEGDTTISKTSAGADPAYEAFDLGRYQTALKLAMQGAERNEPQAATLVARIYQEGLGVSRDDVKAAQWYRRGAELGDINAMFAFGVLLSEGGALKKDPVGAAQMFEQAAAKGHVVANYNLGVLFLTGNGKPENPRRAYAHLLYAAEAGLASAQYELGALYSTGNGVDPDAVQAAKWFKLAAEGGNADAQLDYGVILFQGKGVWVDETAGADMFRRAAEQGNSLAQLWFARCEALGRGAALNTLDASRWYLTARANGIATDPELEKVLAKLSKADRAKVDQVVSDWREQTSYK